MYDRLRGVLDESVGEGTHFRVPWLQQPNVMDVRTRPRTISSVTGTKGGSSRACPAAMHVAAGCQLRLQDMLPSVHAFLCVPIPLCCVCKSVVIQTMHDKVLGIKLHGRSVCGCRESATRHAGAVQACAKSAGPEHLAAHARMHEACAVSI